MKSFIGLVALLTIGWCANASADSCATTMTPACRVAAVRAEVEHKHATHALTDTQMAAAEQRLKENPKGDAVDEDGTVHWVVQASDCCTIRMAFYKCGCKHPQRIVVTVHCPSAKKRPRPHKPRVAVVPPPAPPPVKVHCMTYDMDTRGEPNASRPAVTDLEFYQHSGNPEDANRVFTDNGGCLHAIDLETGEHLSLVKGCGGCELYTHSRQVGLPRDVDERTAATLILHIVQENGKYGCPSGHCRIFLPVGWVKETSLLWCWLAKLTYTYGKMTMFAYFYGITNAENAADVPNGRYHVTVTPIDHL